MDGSVVYVRGQRDLSAISDADLKEVADLPVTDAGLQAHIDGLTDDAWRTLMTAIERIDAAPLRVAA